MLSDDELVSWVDKEKEAGCALKHDTDKLSFSLIPLEALKELNRTYQYGIKKYSRDNWRKGMEYHRIYDAIQRHLMAFWEGENNDSESGLNHLAHAAWGCFTLMEYQRTRVGMDDRKQEEA